MGSWGTCLAVLMAVMSLPGCYSFLSALSGNNNYRGLLKSFGTHQTPLERPLQMMSGADCNRKCVEGEPPRICYFQFIMEHYQTMGAACKNCRFGTHEDCLHPQCITVDGYERGCQSINREIPGTAVEVCLNDIIVVDVHNRMEGTDVSIHWHGIHHRRTPFMDGVPYVTQCPIDYETSFRYAFKATQAGTHFYHSHSGHHKANGHYGKMVIREPDSNDPNSKLYDYDLSEHVILASDWTHDYAEMHVPGLQSSYVTAESMLINGKGRYYTQLEEEFEDSPLAVFRMTTGKRYRFRFINSGSQICPFQLQIEKHRLTIIANDGNPVKPRTVDTLISTSGERYDFIVAANQTIGNYWIRLRAIGPCNIERVETFAVLSYYDKHNASDLELAYPKDRLPIYDHPFPAGIYMNHPNATCYQPGAEYICSSDLQSFDADDELINNAPDQKFVLRYNLNGVDDETVFSGDHYIRFMNAFSTLNFVGVINNISLALASFPLLTQRDQIDMSTFCDAKDRPAYCKNSNDVCYCLHRIKVKLNSTVEIVFIDDSKEIRELNHPLHLHGHHFVITDMGQHFDLEDYKNNVRINKNQPINHLPPKRDTVSVPSHGYAVTRFRAINPGFWIIHCHFEWHLGIGMAMILQVGEHEDMVDIPQGFPKCGNYLPDIKPENL